MTLPSAVSLWTDGNAFGRPPRRTARSVSAIPPETSRPACLGEFRDCQQLIAHETPRILSLFAVLARNRLDSLNVDSIKKSPGLRGVLVGEVYAYDGAYAPLGIEKDFNCLYLRGTSGSGLEAMVVAVHSREDQCAKASTLVRERIPPSNAKYTVLTVTERRMNGGTTADYPPVGQWAWDSVHKRQYIGIRCGLAWCELHSKSHGAVTASKSSTGAGPSARRRGHDSGRLALVVGTRR